MFKANNKNICKVCNKDVSNKSGTQCKGICRGWVHFDCLNLARDKIDDIKSGAISLVCPCPSCKNPKGSLIQNKPLLQKPGDCKEMATLCPLDNIPGLVIEITKEKCEEMNPIKDHRTSRCQRQLRRKTECGVQAGLTGIQVPPKECKRQNIDNIIPGSINQSAGKKESGVCDMCGHKLGQSLSHCSKHGMGVQISSQAIKACAPEKNVCKTKLDNSCHSGIPTQTSFNNAPLLVE